MNFLRCSVCPCFLRISFSRPCVDETVYAGYAARHGRTRTTTKGEPCVSAIRERGLHAAVLGRWYLTGI